jgi:ferredoxin
MKITIDREGCIECGACEAACPDIFELIGDDAADIIRKYRRDSNPAEGEVEMEMAPCAQEAAEACPVSVITIVQN